VTPTAAALPGHPSPGDVAGPLTPVDTAWLRLDRDDNLMVVTAVLWFSTPLERDRFERVVQERLLVRFPRFATRAIRTAGRWRWEPVDVDLRHHVVDAVLPEPGGQAALQRLAGALMGMPLDPQRPAWQFHLVRDYERGSALVARLHHSLADGIALTRVLLQMSDDHTDPPPGTDAAAPGVLRRAARAAVLGGAVGTTLGRLALLPRDPRGVFSGRLGVDKRAAWAEPASLDEVKALGRATGGTVNDVLSAAVAGGLRRYAVERGRLPGDLRAFVPVDLRRGAPVPPQLGNRFGLFLLPLPVGSPNAGVRLRRLRRTVDTLKAGPMAVATYATLGALGLSPARVQDAGARFLATKGSLVMTNVPGPRERVRIAGAELAGVVPWVPQAGGMALGLSVFSYDGRVVLGAAGDARVVPDPEGVLAAIVRELDEFRRLLAPG
jgi:diacylglycerol O-acyltransferase